MIGLSPLSTGHPSLFQQAPVRSSSKCYLTFNLPMDRSPGFGSSCDVRIRPIQTRFRYAYAYRLKLARHMKSLTHYTKGTPSPRAGAPTACRLPISGSISLPSSGCFSPFPHGTCSLSVTGTYLALGDGPPGFPQGFSCPAVLRNQTRELRPFRLRGLHPVSPTIPDRSATKSVSYSPAPLP